MSLDAKPKMGREIYDKFFSARALCLCGLLIMPSALFNPVLEMRVAQFLFFWLLCFLAGKKNNTIVTVSVIFGILAFNLLVPHGLVLYSIGAFDITLGALRAGIHRAVTFQALIMISRLSIRRDLKIPGAFGELVGESLRIFSRITESGRSITRKNFMADIDRLLIKLSEEETTASFSQSSTDVLQTKTRFAGGVILGAIVTISWMAWLPRIFF